MKDVSCIPNGIYCHDENGVCPYWSLVDYLPEMENGYCGFMERSDFTLLWDQCKECEIYYFFDEQ